MRNKNEDPNRVLLNKFIEYIDIAKSRNTEFVDCVHVSTFVEALPSIKRDTAELVIPEYDSYYQSEPIWYFLCPNCRKEIDDYDVCAVNFCGECGQKFDWSEVRKSGR